MFAPFHLRDMRLENRVVVSPMAQYKAWMAVRPTGISPITPNAQRAVRGWSMSR
jgi:2,4-dienoyl-CoA reductase-like NADH-dependent reductase (Old Yellow Enzyme family)